MEGFREVGNWFAEANDQPRWLLLVIYAAFCGGCWLWGWRGRMKHIQRVIMAANYTQELRVDEPLRQRIVVECDKSQSDAAIEAIHKALDGVEARAGEVADNVRRCMHNAEQAAARTLLPEAAAKVRELQLLASAANAVRWWREKLDGTRDTAEPRTTCLENYEHSWQVMSSCLKELGYE